MTLSIQSVFEPGQKLAMIAGPESNGDAFVIRAGTFANQARSIEIVMQTSPFGDLPWALCVMNSGKVHMVNLLHIQEVQLLESQEVAA